MKQFFLHVERSGEPPRPIQSLLGLLAIALAFGCWFLVHRVVPESSALAQLALAALFGGASSGFAVLLILIVKVWQVARIRIKEQSH